MADFTQDDVIASLGNMNVMELIALTKHLEQQWGVEAKPQTVQTITTTTDTVQAVEKTEFDVVFISFPADKKMTLVKLIREVMGLGLLESKNLVEALPKTLKEGISKEEAEALKARLVEAGAVVEIK